MPNFKSFYEFVECCKEIREEYLKIEDEETIKCWKDYVYSLDYDENTLDMIWEHLNENIMFVDYPMKYLMQKNINYIKERRIYEEL